MSAILTKRKISIPKTEYLRLKKFEARFYDFFKYIEHIMDIREARKEVRKKKIIAQEKLFKKLGF